MLKGINTNAVTYNCSKVFIVSLAVHFVSFVMDNIQYWVSWMNVIFKLSWEKAAIDNTYCTQNIIPSSIYLLTE